MITRKPLEPESESLTIEQLKQRIEFLEQELLNLASCDDTLRRGSLFNLASAVTLDMNQLLSHVVGYSDLLLLQPDLSDDSRECLKEINTAGSRAASIVAKLLAASRRAVSRPRIVDLNHFIREHADELRGSIGENNVLILLLDPKNGRVFLDPMLFEMVLMNLADNARDAMPEGGKFFRIETSVMNWDANTPEYGNGNSVDRQFKITVSDTGCGMTPEVKARAFEPFYSTKEASGSKGLGLATAYGIIKNCGGDIELFSEPGHGTTFKIYLPAVNEA